MTLSDSDIKKFINSGKIIFRPLIDFETQLGSCSVDLRLGVKFRVFEHSRIPYFDTKNVQDMDFMKEIIVGEGEPFILQPQDFVLAQTIESITLPDDLLARLEGRSSLGRLGIVVHSTASVFEPGFSGNAVLELGNLGRMPVSLYPGMKICALTFETLSSPAKVPYGRKKNAKYQNQDSPIPSKIFQD